jgi:Inositol phospholipid synthesis and fat-storage-inducing TM
MLNPVPLALVTLSSLLALGTIYSILYSTYLDTSDPLLTHLPHRLHSTHYFANKSNILNIVFIKQAWAWTSAAFAFLFFTSSVESRSKSRLLKYVIVTAAWLGFTSWFFGPALLERAIVATGGECVVVVPQLGDVLNVPVEYCYTKSTLSPSTHPSLFSAFANTNPLSSPWSARPRLRRGHDVSGHIFLLTMSVLFLADQLKPSLDSVTSWSSLHKRAVLTSLALIATWLFATGTTAVYFHSPAEKFSGFCMSIDLLILSQLMYFGCTVLGVSAFALTQMPILNPPSAPHSKVKSHRL